MCGALQKVANLIVGLNASKELALQVLSVGELVDEPPLDHNVASPSTVKTLQQLHDEDQWKDFTFSLGETSKVKVHRCILAALLPEKMRCYLHGLENETGVVRLSEEENRFFQFVIAILYQKMEPNRVSHILKSAHDILDFVCTSSYWLSLDQPKLDAEIKKIGDKMLSSLVQNHTIEDIHAFLDQLCRLENFFPLSIQLACRRMTTVDPKKLTLLLKNSSASTMLLILKSFAVEKETRSCSDRFDHVVSVRFSCVEKPVEVPLFGDYIATVNKDCWVGLIRRKSQFTYKEEFEICLFKDNKEVGRTKLVTSTTRDDKNQGHNCSKYDFDSVEFHLRFARTR